MSLTGAAFGADLGGSSKHSVESTEDRAEKGSSSTAFERGLVGPKPPANALFEGVAAQRVYKSVRAHIDRSVIGPDD